MPSQPQEYSADSIKVLKGLEGVRKRPAMYIGSTGKDGLHHLIYEVVDNSIDEALAGHCTRIEVTLNEDGSVSVKDNGRGIPVEKHSEVKKSALEVVMTMLHAGGKFDKKAYIISGGLHGVGVSVVNALSEKLIVQVRRQGKIYEQTYKRGEAQADVKVVGEAKGETGTMVRFWPDPQIFSSIKYDFATLVTRFRELAFLNSGVTIVLKEEKTKKKEEFLFKGGLLAFIQFLNEGRKVLHKPIYFHKSEEDTAVECVIQYNESYNESIHGFVNTINTVEGGTHVIGFKTALTRVINDYGTKNNMLKNGMKLTGDDVREGLTAIINLKLREPQFEGQTKTKLGNSEVKGFVDSVTSSALASFFEENPSIARKIVTKVIEALQAREAAKKAKELVRRKSALSFGNLPGKLTDCSSNDLEESELFIVEGDSAGGSARQARDKETQAILPLRGKILNVEKANPHKVFLNEEISVLVSAMGTGVGEHFSLENLRYGKIIIMCDADVDGQHIKTLLLTFFFRFIPKLIEDGRIYAAVPPLYKIRKGKEDTYVYDDAELKKVVAGSKVEVQRFKGLGEMNPDQLWETTMHPKKRVLRRITVEDAAEADRIFSILMGSEVEPRRKFIEENAQLAELDI
ncbi:MAG TPA: DNA topoisomerase (ATP-hydrolyzing) subunit B [Nanoarchaeota archaeon]|nr:DNA topoisomerase (ATP-hydrolyzing) subunit B [Nanoarchaeota archaeon]HIH50758.1 DNA topoisomerase (ATP-hydrolyzing) subunit B [Nanoarchaeota archaeon]HIH66240.1 DNA topoisomerase (ATP-hydrolyzing) subunit B [Nanoarchaeota archaeon]